MLFTVSKIAKTTSKKFLNYEFKILNSRSIIITIGNQPHHKQVIKHVHDNL